MGFYGKIYQILDNTFKNFKFKNSGKNSQRFPEADEADEGIITASVENAVVSIDSGNKWIQLREADENGIRLYHTKGQSNVESTITVKDDLSAEEGASAIPIPFGAGLVVKDFVSDEAGHISELKSTIYLMPSTPNISLGEQLEEDVTIIKEAIGLPLDPMPEEDIYSRLTRMESSVDTITTLDETINTPTTGLIDRMEIVEEKTDTVTELDNIINAENDGILARTDRLEETDVLYSKYFGDIETKTQIDIDKNIGLAEVIGDIASLKKSSDSSKGWIVGEDTLVSIIGNINELATSDKKSLVVAINELNTKLTLYAMAIDSLNTRVASLENNS